MHSRRTGYNFDDHLTPNQICSPSRGTMMTGLYPRHQGMTTGWAHDA